MNMKSTILSLLCLIGLSTGQERSVDLDTVLSTRPELSIFWGLVKNNTDYLFQLPTLDGVTILAPNNESFARLPSFDPKNKTSTNALLEYHTLLGTHLSTSLPIGARLLASTKLTSRAYTNVTQGQHVLLDRARDDTVVATSGGSSRATVVDPDLRFAGGVVHVVDAPLVIPQRVETAGLSAHRSDLTAFVAALYAAGLVSDVSDAQNVTIFAPYTPAFQSLSDTLTSLDKDALRRVLKYHVVPGVVVPQSGLVNGTTLTTAAARANVKVHRAGNRLWVNSAEVVTSDVLVANGILHVLSGVLNPDAAQAAPDPELERQPPVFPLSSGRTGATGTRAPTPFTSALPCTVSCPVTTSSATRTTSTTAVRTTTSTGGVGRSEARCTGVVVAAAVGAVGYGLGVV